MFSISDAWRRAFLTLIPFAVMALWFAAPVLPARADDAPITAARNDDAPIVAQVPTPAPTATKKPDPLTYSGYVRSYYLTRLNNPQLSKSNALNQASWNNGFDIHGAYDFGSNISLAATYIYAFPFNGACNTPSSHVGPPCLNPNLQVPGQGTNPDDSLPGFIMNTLYETYLQYKGPQLFVKLGDQVINTPWANPADTRLKPVAFRGGDVGYTIDKNWNIDVMDMTRFEGRAESNFTNSTLLTATKIAGLNYGGMPSNYDQPAYSSVPTNGFAYGRVGYTHGAFTFNGYYYDFIDIAGAYWADGKVLIPGRWQPTLTMQFGGEKNVGKSVLGTVDSQVYGLQGNIQPLSWLNFQAGFNVLPNKSTTMVLPEGVTCSSSGSISAKVPFMYFLPSGGTPQCHTLGNGSTVVYYGGWVSPYTSGYTADPLYSTTITTSFVDRASTGQGLQLQATGFALNNQIRMIARQGWYTMGNPLAGFASTAEFDLDGTFYLNKVRKGTYKGLSFRYRYVDRTQKNFTTNPDFKYNRVQLTYDF